MIEKIQKYNSLNIKKSDIKKPDDSAKSSGSFILFQDPLDL